MIDGTRHERYINQFINGGEQERETRRDEKGKNNEREDEEPKTSRQ